MPHKGVTYARRWATASVTVSALMLLVALSSPRTPLWPFIAVNWLIFVPGWLLVARNANNENGDLQVMRSLLGQLLFALLAFAICGNLAYYVSDSLIKPNDQLTGGSASD